MDYYKKQYDIDVKDLEQPLLLSRLKTRIRGQEVCVHLTRVSYRSVISELVKKNHLKGKTFCKGNIKLRVIVLPSSVC